MITFLEREFKGFTSLLLIYRERISDQIYQELSDTFSVLPVEEVMFFTFSPSLFIVLCERSV